MTFKDQNASLEAALRDALSADQINNIIVIRTSLRESIGPSVTLSDALQVIIDGFFEMGTEQGYFA